MQSPAGTSTPWKANAPPPLLHSATAPSSSSPCAGVGSAEPVTLTPNFQHVTVGGRPTSASPAPSTSSSISSHEKGPTRSPTLMQKVLFAVQTVEAFLVRHPRSRVLVVVANKKVKQYTHHLQERCQPEVRVHHCVDGCMELADRSAWEACLAAHDVLVVSSSAIGDVRQEGAVLQVQAFGLLMLDYDFSRDVYHYQPAFVYLFEKWASLPSGARPHYVDLFTLGQETSETQASGPPAAGTAGASSAEFALGPPQVAADSSATMAVAAQGIRGKHRPSETPQLAPVLGLPLPLAQVTRPEVTLANCQQVFVGYCRSVLGPAIPEAQLYLFAPAGLQGARLQAVQYPTPQGHMCVVRDQVKAAWGGREVEDVVSPALFPGMSAIDRQKAYFLYPVVLELMCRGLLDLLPAAPRPPLVPTHVMPPVGGPDALPAGWQSVLQPAAPLAPPPAPGIAKPASPAPKSPNVRTPDTWAPLVTGRQLPTSLPRGPDECPVFPVGKGSDATPVPGTDPTLRFLVSKVPPLSSSDHDCVEQPQSPAQPPPPAKGDGAASPSESSVGQPPKMRLNELMQLLGRSDSHAPAIRYTTHMGPDGWEATVELSGPVGGRCAVTGEARATKKESEEAAAQMALDMLLSGQE
eukprot:EG_transcript_3987